MEDAVFHWVEMFVGLKHSPYSRGLAHITHTKVGEISNFLEPDFLFNSLYELFA